VHAVATGRSLIPANVLTAFTFSILLARESVSYALGIFPGERWLWEISHGLGFNLLPLLLTLRDTLSCGPKGTLFVLGSLIALTAFVASIQNAFLSLLLLHLAGCSIWFCWTIALIGDPGAFQVEYLLLRTTQIGPLSLLSAILFLACINGHVSYVKTLRDQLAKDSREQLSEA
jgi:hypothetical protein